jgi:hypothetical protein
MTMTLSRSQDPRGWLFWAAVAASCAALLAATACMPPPPAFRRVPLPASVMPKGQSAMDLYLGYNVQGMPERSSHGEFQGSGFNLGGAEGSFGVRTGLPHGLELGGGLGTPDLIPYGELRWQVLGQGWAHGPFLTVEGGANAVPDLHAGLAVGAALGPVEPFVAWRAGNWMSLQPEHPYWEGAGGLALSWSAGRLVLQYSERQDSLDRRVLAQGLGLALELWPQGMGSEPRSRRYRYDPDTAAQAQRTCKGARPLDPFDPAQWDAYADCLVLEGDSQDADAAWAYAKKLRKKPVFR